MSAWRLLAWILLLTVAAPIATGFLLASCGGGGSSSTPMAIPPALVARTDLLYGYYGTWDGAQLGETADHVNLVLLGTHEFTVAQLQEAQQRGITHAVLDVGAVLYQPSPEPCEMGTLKPDPTASAKIRTTLTAIRNAGLLPLLVGFYPIDEPDKHCVSTDQVTVANSVVRAVAREFDIDLPLIVIYGTAGRPGLDAYDVIGEDAYQEGAAAMKRLDSVPAGKKLLLVPGGACPWQNDPEDFYARANADPRVWAIVAFIWPNQWGGTQNCGIRSAPSREAYVRVGKRIVKAAAAQ
jgi:hypothetical protein